MESVIYAEPYAEPTFKQDFGHWGMPASLGTHPWRKDQAAMCRQCTGGSAASWLL